MVTTDGFPKLIKLVDHRHTAAPVVERGSAIDSADTARRETLTTRTSDKSIEHEARILTNTRRSRIILCAHFFESQLVHILVFVVGVSISIGFVERLDERFLPFLDERVQLTQARNHLYFSRILPGGYMLVSCQESMKASE